MDSITKIVAGTPHRMQVSPFGVFAKRHADGTTTEQVCDETAFRRVLTAWRRADCPKILLDWDHDKLHTSAAGWIVGLSLDLVDGLIAMVEFTPAGAESVNAKEYRFISVDWDVADDDNRPFLLRTVGMTNRPNIQVRPILNSTENESVDQTKPEGKPKMEKIAEALGLEATATEADVLAKIEELNGKVMAAEEAKLDVEAKAVAKENATRIENSEAFIAAYKKNPAAVKAAFGSLKAAVTTARRMTNSEVADPVFTDPAPAVSAAKTYDALPDGKDKRAYLRDHAQAIHKARNSK